jgi:hypothetical protein
MPQAVIQELLDRHAGLEALIIKTKYYQMFLQCVEPV